MNIVIIEDERLMAEDLYETILLVEPSARITALLRSVKDAVIYFRENGAPDLIFSDIQLGDGLSFDIFTVVNVQAPVIFCTAYDEYAISAFKANGIDFIMKPFTSEIIEDSLKKYQQLKQILGSEVTRQYEAIVKVLEHREQQRTPTILVRHQDKILPVKLEDIGLLYLRNEITYLLTFSGKTYFSSKNLEEFEKMAGTNFFRANRQSLVNRKAIVNASPYFSRKLSLTLTIPFDETITVSRERAPLLLHWLTAS